MVAPDALCMVTCGEGVRRECGVDGRDTRVEGCGRAGTVYESMPECGSSKPVHSMGNETFESCATKRGLAHRAPS
eukprot:2630908-Prymnesium_polylepis.2